ncbi:hypothetical protein B4096_0161 [Heyndrickxia coagulans]|nr:hypothetical protein B4100_0207 [Heyndrickxia coagulans]KYC90497.1 hypothetical protein B4096_0161 [Heyndrickxia coagulans]
MHLDFAPLSADESLINIPDEYVSRLFVWTGFVPGNRTRPSSD